MRTGLAPGYRIVSPGACPHCASKADWIIDAQGDIVCGCQSKERPLWDAMYHGHTLTKRQYEEHLKILYILGTPESLLRLSASIAVALDGASGIPTEFRTKDGVLYGVITHRVDDVRELERMMLPYASASGPTPGLHPTYYGDDLQHEGLEASASGAAEDAAEGSTP